MIDTSNQPYDSPVTQYSSSLTWRPLRQFNTYRFLLALALLVAYLKIDWLPFLGSAGNSSFLITAIALLMSSLLFYLLAAKRRPDFESQVILSNTSDIILISLLSHFSGGLSSSLMMLLIINVTATGTFLRFRESFVFAALATIAILAEQTFQLMSGTSDASEYTRAGLLGLVFFAVSFLASVLSARVKESEQLARKQKQDILSLQKLNADILQNMRTGIIVVDNDGHIRMANTSAESLLGNIDLQQRPLLENILPALDARFLEWQEQPQMSQNTIRQKQGLPDIQPGFRKLTATGDTLIFLEDATQLNQRFQQIKLASLGRLTASIAHEIRNPLSAINHASQLLQESELDLSDTKLTKIINTQVQRLDKVVQNVLQLSRQQNSLAEIIDLKPWMETFRQEFILAQKIKEHQLEIVFQQEDIQILFNTIQLNQIIDNICSNAIIHSQHKLEDIQINILCALEPEHHQPYIDITDNGPGIDEETLQQVFDPFFTTSTLGTGLGLYICKEMLESNRAKIHYIQKENSGSTFRIHFLSPSQTT